MIGGAVVLASIPAILALVNLAKQFGVAGKWSAVLAAVLGVVFAEADYLFGVAGVVVSAPGVYSAGAAGLVLGLSASGLYDVTAKLSDALASKSSTDSSN